MLAALIPESFFENVGPDWWLWILAAGAIAVLVVGADRLVASAVKLATALGMSTIIIGATVVSLGTTSPEAFVSVTAAFQDKPGLALGNGVGSIICDTALVFGLCSCIGVLPKDRFILRRHGWLQFAAGASLTVLLFVLAGCGGSWHNVYVPRAAGFVCLALLAGYLCISAMWAKQHHIDMVKSHARVDPAHRLRAVLVSVAVLVVGLAMVMAGANVLVGSVGQLCKRYGAPPNVLAVTLVAFGTSLPELVTAIASIVKGHPELLVGNIIGADILNVLFVIGASSVAAPLAVPVEFYYLHLPVLMASLVLFRCSAAARRPSFSRLHGGLLVALFVAYYATMLALVWTGVLGYHE